MRKRDRFELADGPVPDTSKGVFETMLVVNGEPLELESHLSRISTSVAELYGVQLPTDAVAIVAGVAAGISLGRLRLDAVPTGHELGLDAVARTIEAGIVNPRLVDGSDLVPFRTNPPTGSHKWGDRRRLEILESAETTAVPLLLTNSDEVLETSRGNIFIVSGDTVTTPPLDGRILPGVTRAIALELAAAQGLQTRERTLGIDALLAADEVFTTGSIRGIEPVSSCAGVDWHREVITPMLAEGLRRRWPPISS
jgi:para-aminobenzoate synthetase/4-amino-4-deoxychorismate lyase